MKKAAPTTSNVITPFRHQQQIVSAPHQFLDVDWFLLAGGYGCGKSFSIVLCVLDIVQTYNGHEIAVGIGSTTITLAMKTVWKDLQAILKRSHSDYNFNKKDNVLTIGTVMFYFIATEQPGDIYGYNFNIFLCDEIDELSQQKVIEANKAISERTRLSLPDGRIPYIMYFTTVHGYSGLYNVVQELKRAKLKFVLIRGLTKDNTTFQKSYIDRLYKIYDDNERMAYLEGKFVNLKAGRVYLEYDEEKCRVDNFEIVPSDVIMVGQDLNSGFSKAVAIVKRAKCLYIVKAWSFQDIGQAPEIMRRTFPENQILWYPDCSGKEVLKGYKQEIIDYGIECRIGTANPRIIDRVFYVNKLFRLGLLKAFTKGTEICTEALKTRQYAENGQPEKGKGEEAPDHICDGLEYVIYRIVRSDADFLNLKELSRENVKENGYLQIAERNRN